MRFDRNRKPPPYLNRRDQMRMLKLVGMLCVVVIGIKLAANPDNWTWMFPGSVGDKTATGEQPGTRRGTSNTIDFSVRKTSSKTAGAGGGAVHLQPTLPPGAKTTEGGPRGSADVAFDRTILNVVKDRTLSVRRRELDAYFFVLDHASRVSQRALERAAQTGIAFAVLMDDVEARRLRGAPITLQGQARSIRPLPDEKNRFGVKDTFEAWVLTPESGTTPYRVVFTELPAELRPSDHYERPPDVRVTGYFFKIQGYETRQGEHSTPLVLAARLEYRPPPVTAAGHRWLAPVVVAVAVVIGLSLGLTIWRFSVSDRTFQEKHLVRLTEPPREAIDALKTVKADDPGEFFQKLADKSNDGT